MGIHQTAIIDGKAELGSGVEIGPFCVIEGDTVIGEGTRISSHAVIKKGTRIGRNCAISHGAVLGGEPQDTKFKGETSYLVVGDENIIREYVTLHRGSGEGCETRLGNNNMLMANSHMGHNSTLGDHSVIANNSALGGFVSIGSHTFIGGLSGFHQFVTVGDYVMVGGASSVFEDLPHYMLISGGHRTPVCSLNTVGLMRAGFPENVRCELRKAFRILYKRGLGRKEAIAAMKSELEPLPEIGRLIDFITNSQRGIVRGRCRLETGS